MNMYPLISQKKEGKVLTKEQIEFFVSGVTDGTVPDYQTAAFLMAVCLKGMNLDETTDLTRAMMHSGRVVDLSCFGKRSVDKHSTGGVGDKTTLILAPIVACAGGIVAKMSGRGLGFTGGTVDKIESIPGMRTSLSAEEFFRISEKVGMCVIGQSEGLAPADKKLYALRDVTATIDSIPLIASSIMSKKLAAGAHNIVLDVKFGSGAFMKTKEEAEMLARTMTAIGRGLGRRVRALITDMDVPLGNYIGNRLEVQEALQVLRGEGDAALRELCLALASHMIAMSMDLTLEEAARRAQGILSSGKAFAKMKEWVTAQGGDPAFLENGPKGSKAVLSYPVQSPKTGYLSCMDTEKVGFAASALGAGRRTKEDKIDPDAGIVLSRKTGDFVKEGELLATFYASEASLFKTAEIQFLSSLSFSEEKIPKKELIAGVIE